MYSEDVSKRIGNEPIVQALKELMKCEMAMLVTDDEDDKSLKTDAGARSNHDNVDAAHSSSADPPLIGQESRDDCRPKECQHHPLPVHCRGPGTSACKAGNMSFSGQEWAVCKLCHVASHCPMHLYPCICLTAQVRKQLYGVL